MLRAAGLLARSGRRALPLCTTAPRALAAEFSASPLHRQQEEEGPKPSIPVYGTEGRYASALFTAAAKAQKLGTVERELIEIYNLTADNDAFDQFLKDPSIPKKTKLETLNAILSDMNVSDLTKRFFAVLAENNRLSLFDRITDTFEEIMAAARGEVKATVTTARPMEEGEVEELRSSLGNLIKEGETLVLDQRVDPAIIGGLVLDIADKHVDMSILKRVKTVQQAMMETI